MAFKPELPDDQLIRESNGKNFFSFWIYLAIIFVIIAFLWGIGNWVYERQQKAHSLNPFLQVSNRDFSLFLWQFPEYMRANVSSKNGYLPDFQYEGKGGIILGKAEQDVVAPPQVIFLYHVWNRLIGNQFSKRPISNRALHNFLENFPEWKPENWAAAPAEYRKIVENLSIEKIQDIPLEGVPYQVQMAYIGWKNYFIEGDLINQVKPTYEDMGEFINAFPVYSRNYWRNITLQGKPNYLKQFFLKNYSPTTVIPEEELTSFLKVAFFNFQQSKKGL